MPKEKKRRRKSILTESYRIKIPNPIAPDKLFKILYFTSSLIPNYLPSNTSYISLNICTFPFLDHHINSSLTLLSLSLCPQPSLMATNTLQSINHNTHDHVLNHNSIIDTPPSTISSLFFSNPTPAQAFLSLSFSIPFLYNLSRFFQQHLSNQDLRQADAETRRLLIVLAGDDAKKRGYVFFAEVKLISKADLKAIDDLWKQYSNNRFGYCVQKRIFGKVNRDFTKLFIKIGLMKKLETEIEQYNYRSFPSEFIWDLSDDTVPGGHLPLTNALRSTQLFFSILTQASSL